MGLVDSEKYTDGEPGSMSFDKLDKLVKAFLRKEYKHMAKYLWNGKREKLTKGTPKRIKRYADEIYELYSKKGSKAKERWAVSESCSLKSVKEWFAEAQEALYDYLDKLAPGCS